ncbi:MAG: tol-pal system protein YbgF [Desulfovibrio sp.]|nr:tol-pal system protein YbgF [Desulfovibrio sp.]
MRTKYLLPCIVLLCLPACAGSVADKRLTALEKGRASDGKLLSMRLDGMEKRLERVEENIGEIRSALAPKDARKTRSPAADAREQAASRPAPPVRPGAEFDYAALAAAMAAPRSAPPRAPASPPVPAATTAPSPAPAARALPLPAPAPAPAPPASPASPVDRSDPADRGGGPSLVPLDLRASQGSAPVAAARPPDAARAPDPAGRAGPSPAAAASTAGKTPPSQTPARGAGQSRDAAGRAAYDASLSLYNKHRYAQAAEAFSAFLRAAPQSPLAPNAGYWLGECRYSTGNYGDAVIAFKDVAAKYPGHPKAAAALLKAAYAYERMGDADNARFYRQLLLDDYPSSGPAALARKRTGAR